MMQNTISRILLCCALGLCSLSIGYAQEVYLYIMEGYTPVRPPQERAISLETSYRSYQSTVYEPFSDETPSSSASAAYGVPRRTSGLGGETVDPGNPPGKGSPVGDPVLPLLGAALLAAGGVSIRRRKKKMLNNKINNN